MGIDKAAYALAKRNEFDISNVSTDIFNTNDGLRKWRSAKSKAVATTYKAQICVAGDSISEGAYSSLTQSEWLTKGYLGIVRNVLSAKYGDCGTGIIPHSFPQGAPFIAPVGFVDSVGGATGEGIANHYYRSATVGHTLTYTFVGTGVEVYYVQGSSSGNFTYSIDGGGATPVTARTTPTTFCKTLLITGLSDASHTIVITQNDAGNFTQILAMCPIKGTKGIQVNLVGRFGTTAEPMSLVNCLTAEFTPKPPDLTVVALTANDFSSQTDLTLYKSCLQKIITQAKLTGDVLITTIGVRNLVSTIPQTSYNAVCKALSEENNCAYLDIYSRWQSGATANANGLLYDTVHPNEIGHQDIATAVLKVIDEY